MTRDELDVAAFLEKRREPILKAGRAAVARARLEHYEAAGPAVTDERLQSLLEHVIEGCRDRRVEAALAYADRLVAERVAGGFALAEVQTAVNVMEEAIWQEILGDAPPDDQGLALALVSTVLGAVKDRVARGYLARITGTPPPSLNVESLFAGTEHPWAES